MIILMEHDLDAAVAFYTNLGLNLKFRMKDTWAEFELKGMKIGLCQSGLQEPQPNRTGIVFEVADLNALYEKQKETITFISKPIEAAHGIMTSIQDPGGNIIDVYQPTPEKLKATLAQQQGCNPDDACCKPQPEACCKETQTTGCC